MDLPLITGDIWEALESGRLPGAFSDDRCRFDLPTVLLHSGRGAELNWTASVRLFGPGGRPAQFTAARLGRPAPELAGFRAEILGRSWQGAGADRLNTKPTVVTAGKNLGSANATNVASQALRDAYGLWRAKAKKAAAAEPAAAGPSLLPPMLLKKIGTTAAATLTGASRGHWVQLKYNGVRAVAMLEPTGVGLFSRTLERYPGLNTLRAECGALLAAAGKAAKALGVLVPEGLCLDGELYAHTLELRLIVGAARRSAGSAEEDRLKFMAFDCYASGAPLWPSGDRAAFLKALFAAAPAVSRVQLVANVPLDIPPDATADQAEKIVRRLSDQAVAAGFEGIVVRAPGVLYEPGRNGYHSAAVIKVKPAYDREFPVCGFTEGVRGKDKGAVIWQCSAGGTAFSVTPNLPYEMRYHIYKHLSDDVGGLTRFERDFRGQLLTVQFAELSSKTQLPLQPKALGFRAADPIEGRAHADPVNLLLADHPLA